MNLRFYSRGHAPNIVDLGDLSAKPDECGDPSGLVRGFSGGMEALGVLGRKPKHTRIADIIETAWRWHSRGPEGFGGNVE